PPRPARAPSAPPRRRGGGGRLLAVGLTLTLVASLGTRALADTDGEPTVDASQTPQGGQGVATESPPSALVGDGTIGDGGAVATGTPPEVPAAEGQQQDSMPPVVAEVQAANPDEQPVAGAGQVQQRGQQPGAKEQPTEGK